MHHTVPTNAIDSFLNNARSILTSAKNAFDSSVQRWLHAITTVIFVAIGAIIGALLYGVCSKGFARMYVSCFAFQCRFTDFV